MANELEKRCTELQTRTEKAFGSRLVSLILYGSAARGDQHERFSDLNVLCVLDRITPAELGLAEPIFHWWRGLENPSPLLLSAEELATSTDCFAIEFHDIQESHRILSGRDVVADLAIDDSFYRGRVEFEFRAKQLRLRQKAAGVLSDKVLLTRLMAESVSTFLTLSRHALRLAGLAAPHPKREIAAAITGAFGVDAVPFYTLLDLREGRLKPRDVDPPALFAKYLQQIETLVASVDRLQR